MPDSVKDFHDGLTFDRKAKAFRPALMVTIQVDAFNTFARLATEQDKIDHSLAWTRYQDLKAFDGFKHGAPGEIVQPEAPAEPKKGKKK